MSKVIELIEEAIEKWRISKGVGSIKVPKLIDDKNLLIGVLQKIYNKSPTTSVVIIVKDFHTRSEIIEFLTTQGNENDEEFKELLNNKTIKVLTENFVSDNTLTWVNPVLCIWYRPYKYSTNIILYLNSAKFKLVIFDKLFDNTEDLLGLYKCCPILDTFGSAKIEEARLSTPVEEMLVSVTIDDNSQEQKLLTHYNDIINKSFAIFGDFKLIEQARTGDKERNKSAIEVCYEIASKNGWNNHLDMSFEFNRQIDELYNPNALNDRAKQIYETIRNRIKLVSEYYGKLDKICKIVEDNPDKNILIINKSGEFASLVTSYINSALGDICGNYHDKVDAIPAVDVDNNPLFYKSGVQKGKRRMIGDKAQRTLNQSLFNSNKLRVLSTNNAVDKDLTIAVDIVIITSPLCEKIENYFYRLSYCAFTSPLKLFTIYVENTMEERIIREKTETKFHKIVNKLENNVLVENNSGFLIVD